MPTSEIIAIGTELLLGEIQDTNTRDIALFLRNNGIDLYRATIVGDNIKRITHAIQDALPRTDIIITSGGLGPTVDDPTREAVAQALDVDLIFHSELWGQIQERFKKFGRIATKNNMRQAYIPGGALPVENHVGTAPAFIIDTGDNVIICLPGVPHELHYLIENEISRYLSNRYDLHEIIKACVIHTAGVGESQIDEWISDLETNPNPTVGLLAKPGQTDIRITVKAGTEYDADKQIGEMLKTIQNRLGDNIYGMDDETLEDVILSKLKINNLQLVVLECGLDGKLFSRMENANIPVFYHENFSLPCLKASYIHELEKKPNNTQIASTHRVILSATLIASTLALCLKDEDNEKRISQSFGGSQELLPQWATNITLDFLRRNI